MTAPCIGQYTAGMHAIPAYIVSTRSLHLVAFYGILFRGRVHSSCYHCDMNVSDLTNRLTPNLLRLVREETEYIMIMFVIYSPLIGARRIFSRGGQIKGSGGGSYPACMVQGGTPVGAWG